MIEVPIEPDFEAWRQAARRLLAEDRPPETVHFVEGSTEASLFLNLTPAPSKDESEGRPSRVVPADFLEAAADAACFRDASRWSLLYRILWRLTHAEPRLMELIVDDDVHRLIRMQKAVRRDSHKMKAFVRFRRVTCADGAEAFIAWHRPDHLVVRRVAPFFADRFAPMRWTILTPDASALWDPVLRELSFGAGVAASAAPTEDGLEEFWRTYYASIFNPARLMVRAMQKELPKKHWPTLPEAALIPDLIHSAAGRVEAMTTMPRVTKSHVADRAGEKCASTGSAADFHPARITLPQLREAAAGCHGCDLYCNATQTVFGDGPAHAKLMFVGEQPGDQEDRAGKPFVGPSGQLLDEALEEATIPRDDVYITNAVKHFKFEPRGTRRIHAKPNAREIRACRPWLESEIKVIKPQMIVCLGATAAQSLMGSAFRLTQHRGEPLKTEWAPWLLATNHPSAILRVPDEEMRRRSREQFFDDMKIVAKYLARV